MAQPEFRPGFRFSRLDAVVLVLGVAGSAVSWAMVWWVGFVIAFVVAHFFLFCNIVRMSRPLELTWAAVFVTLAGGTITSDQPGWMVTILGSLATTSLVVLLEMKRPSYHGVFWRTLNPKLSDWWREKISNDHPAG